MRTLPRRSSIALVGPGAVGVTLAALLRRKGHRINAVIGRSPAKTRRIGRLLGAPVASTSVSRIPPETRLVVIAVPDEQIASVAESLAAHRSLAFKRMAVFHCSGLATSELLAPLAKKGAVSFALHPIQTFPAKRSLPARLRTMKGIWYGFQGPPRAKRIARRIVKDLAGRTLTIPKQKKILYHTACVFASNYPVVLLDIVEDLAKAVSPAIGLEAFRPLTESSIAHAVELSPRAALTGPVARASVRSVEQHRRALNRHAPAIDELYRMLALAALRMAERRGRTRAEDLRKLRNILRRRQ